MNTLRSFLFNIQFYIGTSILVTLCLPCLLFPRSVVLCVNRIWCLIMIKAMKWWLNTEIKVMGNIPSKNKVVIYAIKHQSAWETIFCTDLFSMPSIVLKTLEKGKKVVFISDDPASPIDFSHFSENEGYSISIKTSDTGKHFFILSKLEI